MLVDFVVDIAIGDTEVELLLMNPEAAGDFEEEARSRTGESDGANQEDRAENWRGIKC